jgi:hypothetical protein
MKIPFTGFTERDPAAVASRVTCLAPSEIDDRVSSFEQRRGERTCRLFTCVMIAALAVIAIAGVLGRARIRFGRFGAVAESEARRMPDLGSGRGESP